MDVKLKYLDFKRKNNLNTGHFLDRVILQKFLLDHYDEMCSGIVQFNNGGLFKNNMTNMGIGFSYIDCRPSDFCQTRCYGLRVSGIFDFYMLRLAVITSESLKNNDSWYISQLNNKIKTLTHLKIGHWGDISEAQIPAIVDITNTNSNVTFWLYTRKIEIATIFNSYNLNNFRAYLSIDPSTEYPSFSEYPGRLTYLVGDGLVHKDHDQIVRDDRVVSIFTKKRGKSVEDPSQYNLRSNPKVCMDVRLKFLEIKKDKVCLTCRNRCNFSNERNPLCMN